MTPCIEWKAYRNALGYGSVKYDGRMVLAHRKVMADLHGWDAIEGKVVMHTCDNPPCINPEHLRIGTPAENQQDSVAKGRNRYPDNSGERNGRARLTTGDVQHIRTSSLNDRALARHYGVGVTTVRNARIGKTWRTA